MHQSTRTESAFDIFPCLTLLKETFGRLEGLIYSHSFFGHERWLLTKMNEWFVEHVISVETKFTK